MKLTQYNYQLKKSRQKRFAFVLIYCICLFILVNLILTFLVYPVRQTSISMNPDVPEKSVVMVSPLVNNYERGSVVLVKSRTDKNMKTLKFIWVKLCSFFTGQQYSPVENENLSGTKEKIRRIVGIPGDTIYMRDYVLYVKPKGEKHYLTEFEITPKTYNVTFLVAPASWDSSIGVKGSFDEITLKDNEYFVLGDNRKATNDSRLWGTVKDEDIAAKVLFCYFPFNKFKIY